MKILATDLQGVVIIEPDIYADERGYFKEIWNKAHFHKVGLPYEFVQDNVSYSSHGVLRGLHFQYPIPQGKLVSVLHGSVFDAVVDVRVGSPSFGKWIGVVLSEKNHRQLFIPEGFAHGFYVESDSAVFTYKCTEFYSPKCETGIFWNDPSIRINWPCSCPPILSARDRTFRTLSELSPLELPKYSI